MNGKAFIMNFALPFVQHAPHHIKYDTLLCLKRSKMACVSETCLVILSCYEKKEKKEKNSQSVSGSVKPQR